MPLLGGGIDVSKSMWTSFFWLLIRNLWVIWRVRFQVLTDYIDKNRVCVLADIWQKLQSLTFRRWYRQPQVCNLPLVEKNSTRQVNGQKRGEFHVAVHSLLRMVGGHIGDKNQMLWIRRLPWVSQTFWPTKAYPPTYLILPGLDEKVKSILMRLFYFRLSLSRSSYHLWTTWWQE
jgi:hypothetical protein